MTTDQAINTAMLSWDAVCDAANGDRDKMFEIMHEAARQLAGDYTTLALNYANVAPQTLELINQCSIAEAQLVQVQFFLRKAWAMKRGMETIPGADEIAKIEGNDWMLKILTNGLGV